MEDKEFTPEMIRTDPTKARAAVVNKLNEMGNLVDMGEQLLKMEEDPGEIAAIERKLGRLKASIDLGQIGLRALDSMIERNEPAGLKRVLDNLVSSMPNEPQWKQKRTLPESTELRELTDEERQELHKQLDRILDREPKSIPVNCLEVTIATMSIGGRMKEDVS